MEIRKTPVFDRWLKGLGDSNAKIRIHKRIARLSTGNPGDVKPVGEGVSEMRIDYGPGYRVYYRNTGLEIILLLCGGDKRGQQADIEMAKRIAREVEEGNGNQRV